MSFNYNDNHAKLASSVTQTNRTNLGGVSTTLPLITYMSNSARATRANNGPEALCPSAAHNTVLPNSLKSPSSILILNGAPNLLQTDINESFNRFRDEVIKSIETSLGMLYKLSLPGILIRSCTLLKALV